jgi:hypothetical protein
MRLARPMTGWVRITFPSRSKSSRIAREVTGATIPDAESWWQQTSVDGERLQRAQLQVADELHPGSDDFLSRHGA